jgi:2,3-bisphosphoglycerate-dependent phosphoglycerate mutase
MKYIIIILIPFIFSSCTTKYYIVRHAEKADNTEESLLTNEGRKRASDLGNYFVSNRIKLDSIFTSDAPRTMLTGTIVTLATAIHIEPVKHRDQNSLNVFVERLQKISNKNVLIVSHSTVIPNLIQKMSGLNIRNINEDEYDNLYILTRKGNDWSIEHTLYGKLKLTTDVFNSKQPIK